MKFAILDPRPIPAAQAANDAIFASDPVLGIEVAVLALASRCDLGNIDPQHGSHRETYDNGSGYREGCESTALPDESAIEFAARQPIPGQGWTPTMVPPDNATLVTVRADLDSVGAMAVLAMIAERIDFSPALNMAPADISPADRIRLIAEADKFARGGWPGPKPLPTEDSLFDDSSASAETDSRLAPMAAAVSDFKIPLDQRVEWMRRWLLTGEEPEGYRERWLDECRAIAKAIADGTIKTELTANGKIAVVISTHRAATQIGYCLASVVVALNPKFRSGGGEPYRKFTVCQFTADYVNLNAVKNDLAALETGWGGSPTIIGSPQGASSTLTIERVVEVVERHLLK